MSIQPDEIKDIKYLRHLLHYLGNIRLFCPRSVANCSNIPHLSYTKVIQFCETFFGFTSFRYHSQNGRSGAYDRFIVSTGSSQPTL